MIGREFILNKNQFQKKKLTILQHKLRVVMKCYTVTNFILNDDNTFSFQKSFKKYGIKITDPKINTGSLVITDIDETDEIILRINVN